MNKDTKWYLTELRGEECFCGRKKKSGYSFCFRCYKSLPRHMQQDLYCVVGDGYEEAYDAAVEWLT